MHYYMAHKCLPCFSNSPLLLNDRHKYIDIYIIYTPNLGLGITVLNLGREYSRFKGSNEGALKEYGVTEGARGSIQ